MHERPLTKDALARAAELVEEAYSAYNAQEMELGEQRTHEAEALLLGDLSPSARIVALRGRSLREWRRGDLEACIRTIGGLLYYLGVLGDEAALIRTLCNDAAARVEAGAPIAIERLDWALLAARRHPSPVYELMVRASRANALESSTDPLACYFEAASCVRLARSAGEAEWLAWAVSSCSDALHRMALPHRRLTVTREGTRAAEAAGQARRVLGCKLDLFAALIGVGDLAAAEALGAELQEIIDESRRDAFVSCYLLNVGELALALGQPARACAAFQGAHRARVEVGRATTRWLPILGELRAAALAGDTAAAVPLADRLDADPHAPGAARLFARVLATDGRAAARDATHALDMAAAMASRAGLGWLEHLIRKETWAARWLAGDEAGAARGAADWEESRRELARRIDAMVEPIFEPDPA